MHHAVEILEVLDGHLDYFRFLDPGATLLHVVRRDEFAQVGQAVVHAISAPLFDDPVRVRVLLLHVGWCLGTWARVARLPLALEQYRPARCSVRAASLLLLA